MDDSSDNQGGRVRSGFVTDRDKEWLEGNKSGQNSATFLRQGITEVMKDIKYLFEVDFEEVEDPPVDSVGELFSQVDEKADMTHKECATYLIALAFIAGNEPIDYSRIVEDVILHPRKEGEKPKSEDRATKGALADLHQPIDDILTFRDALTAGIKLGKSHVEREQNNVDLPNIVLVDSNTKLYKEPVINRLDPNNLNVGLDTDDWRDAFASAIDSGLKDDNSPDDFSRKEAAQHMQIEIGLNIESRLTHRRQYSDQDISRHGAVPGRYTSSPYQRKVSMVDVDSSTPGVDRSIIDLDIDLASDSLSAKTLPEVELTIGNPGGDPVIIQGTDPAVFLTERKSSPKELLLVTESERERGKVRSNKGSIPEYDPDPPTGPSEQATQTLEPDEDRTVSFYIAGDANELDIIHPSQGEYQFNITIKAAPETPSKQTHFEEFTLAFSIIVQ